MNNRVLITGASQGLGLALLRHYSRANCEIIAVDQATLSAGDRHPLVQFHLMDVTKQGLVTKLVNELAEANRLPDQVIFSAAIHEVDNDPFIDYALMSRVMEVDLMSIFRFLACLLPRLNKPCTFIFCSSGVIIFPNPANLGYYLAKLAVTNAFELFDSRYYSCGFRFKSVVLGPLRSPMLAHSRPPGTRLVKLARDLTTGDVETAAQKIADFTKSPRSKLYYKRSSAVILWLTRCLQGLLPKSIRFYQVRKPDC